MFLVFLSSRNPTPLMWRSTLKRKMSWSTPSSWQTRAWYPGCTIIIQSIYRKCGCIQEKRLISSGWDFLPYNSLIVQFRVHWDHYPPPSPPPKKNLRHRFTKLVSIWSNIQKGSSTFFFFRWYFLISENALSPRRCSLAPLLKGAKNILQSFAQGTSPSLWSERRDEYLFDQAKTRGLG